MNVIDLSNKDLRKTLMQFTANKYVRGEDVLIIKSILHDRHRFCVMFEFNGVTMVEYFEDLYNPKTIPEFLEENFVPWIFS